MTDTKFSDFIRNATPEEKARVYGEVMDEACEMQRKALADTEEGRDRLKAPITPDDFGVPAEWRERAENYARWLASCEVNTLARQLAEAIAAKEAAERRAAEVEQKAKRYDWLRDKSYGQRQHPIVVSQHRMSYASIDTTHYVGPLFGDALDQAIDAAIAAGEKT